MILMTQMTLILAPSLSPGVDSLKKGLFSAASLGTGKGWEGGEGYSPLELMRQLGEQPPGARG